MTWFTHPKTLPAERLSVFIEQLKKTTWSGKDTDALQNVFISLNSLIQEYARYYTASSDRHRRVSNTTRRCTWFLGTLGLLAPVIGNIPAEILPSLQPAFKAIAACGYPILATAAASHMFNRMFGSTRGHIRYVTAKLRLENLIEDAQIQWQEWLSLNHASTMQETKKKEAFAMFNSWLKETHLIVQTETAAWAVAIVDDMETVNSQLSGRGSQHRNPASKNSASEATRS